MVGRPVVWGLACGGEQGVYEVLSLLRDELVLAMKLCGVPSIKVDELKIKISTIVANVMNFDTGYFSQYSAA